MNLSPYKSLDLFPLTSTEFESYQWWTLNMNVFSQKKKTRRRKQSRFYLYNVHYSFTWKKYQMSWDFTSKQYQILEDANWYINRPFIFIFYLQQIKHLPFIYKVNCKDKSVLSNSESSFDAVLRCLSTQCSRSVQKPYVG